MADQGALATEFAEAEQSPGLQLWRVTNRWQARMRSTLKPLGLTHVQFVLLASLTYLDEAEVTQAELAAHAGTDPMMTSQVLRALEALELIRRDPHPHDRRARLLVATAAGVERANRAVAAVEAADREFFASLGSDGPRFAELLGRLR
ncbi:MarR family transcriptional regulator [Microbacteriaceae bacterium VKM Ac-2854]|nr:MarR family transcriptional regulator [Microbacteriaceae bacterium VKM Ac-2854]